MPFDTKWLNFIFRRLNLTSKHAHINIKTKYIPTNQGKRSGVRKAASILHIILSTSTQRFKTVLKGKLAVLSQGKKKRQY